MTTLRNMMMGVMLMGSVTMAFPAMSQVMTGHRGTNSGQSSGMGAPAVERKSSNRSMMGMPSAPAGRGSGNNIERRMQPSAPQQQSGSRSSAFGGGRVFGAGGSHNAMQSSPASEARRETQPSVNHWPSQNNSTPRQFGGDAPSRRNESTGNRRVFGGNNDFSRNTGGGPVKVESRQYNNPGSNFGSAGNGGGSGRMPGRAPGNSGMAPGKNNGGGNFNAPSGNNNNGGPGRRPGYNPGNNRAPGGNRAYAPEPPRQERYGGYRNRGDFDRRRHAINRNYRRGFWHGAFVPPPPRPYRPRYVSIYAPVRPYGWTPRYGVPLIDGVLGLTFGTLYDAALNYLYDMNYAIDGWANDLVYLRDVPVMRFTWPDAMIRFDSYRRMNYVQLVYSSPYYDRSRLRSLYSDLCVTYGSPVSFRDDALTQVSWYGGDGRGYVTLRYNNVNGRYYTTLSFGR